MFGPIFGSDVLIQKNFLLCTQPAGGLYAVRQKQGNQEPNYNRRDSFKKKKHLPRRGFSRDYSLSHFLGSLETPWSNDRAIHVGNCRYWSNRRPGIWLEYGGLSWFPGI